MLLIVLTIVPIQLSVLPRAVAHLLPVTAQTLNQLRAIVPYQHSASVEELKSGKELVLPNLVRRRIARVEAWARQRILHHNGLHSNLVGE
jgi:hypothetical protein